MNENVDILEDNFHAPGVGDEIGREVPAAKLHAAELWLVVGAVQKDASVAEGTIFFDTSPNAVSYTHLDVYKRQVRGRAAPQRRVRPSEINGGSMEK